MAPSGTRSAPKRKATTTAAEPAAKKAKTTATPNTSKKVTARSAVLAAGKANPVAKKSSTVAAKKAAPKSTTVASKKAPTKAPATASKKATPKPTATASKKAPTTSTATATKKAPAKATASAAKKAAAPAKATATTTKKRKRDDEEDEEEDDDDDKDGDEKEEEVKKAARPAKKIKAKVVINDVPVQKLDVYVFGEGSSGELGLGIAKTAIDVKRPRLNPLLSAKDVGVVQIATGGMHVLVLTKDNHVLTWGVNDHGALGRDTAWDGGMEDIADSKSNSDSDDAGDSGLNPRESTPTAISSDCFPAGTVFVKVAAGDSLSLALTDDGHVYGWGTFRGNDGIVGFSNTSRVQHTPVLIPALTNITDIACGANHALALDTKGNVYIWGSGEQNQLGYRVVLRTRGDALIPRLLRLRKKIRAVGCGQDHSFAVGKDEQVYAWGLNSFGETAIAENAGDDGAVVANASVVPSLKLPNNDTITQITGGAHHSVAVTASGRCLIWGRLDGSQTGCDPSTLPEDDIIKDAKGVPRILIGPTDVPNVVGATFAAVGTDNTIVIDGNGKAWSWGFSANYQTGLGTDDDVTTPTMIQNTAVRDKVLVWAGAGGQFSMLASAHIEEEAEAGAGPSGANGQ